MLGIFKRIPWFRRSAALPRATVAMEQLMKGNPLWAANPDRVVAAVAGWDAGNIAELARLVEAYEFHDDTAKIGVKKRDASVARCEHTVLIEEGREKDPRAQLHRDILTKFWSGIRCTSAFNRAQRGGIRLLKKQMMSAQSIGWSCHNIVWDTSNPNQISANFIHIPMWHFENLTGELRFKQLVSDYYGVPMADGEWLVHTGDAIGPAVALACCAKRLSLQDWMLFSERASIPGLLAKTDATFGTDAWNRLVEMLDAWGRDWRGVVDRDTDLTTVSLNGSGAPPMPRLVERMDRAIAALYRGADLSTISKGEGLGASLQGEESDMLEIDDCTSLSESLHEQVDRYVIRYMTGDETPLAYIWIEPVSKPNLETEMSVDKHLLGCGIKLSKRDMLQRYGRTEADPADPNDAAALQTPSDGPEMGARYPFGTPRGLTNAATPLQNAKNALQNARREPDGQGEGETLQSEEEAFLAAFAKDSSPAAEAVRRLLADLTPGRAAEFAAQVPDLLPGEDSAMAAVLADAAARAATDAWERAKALHDDGEASAGAAELANEITNPCPKCHRQMSKDGTCSFCAKRAANHAAGKAAFAEVAKTHQDKIGAMERDSIGKIDFIWGDKSEGVCHILDGHSETANQIPGVIAYGDVYENAAEGKYYVVKKRYVAVLRKQTGSNHYLITGFRAESPNYVTKIRKEYSLVEKGE